MKIADVKKKFKPEEAKKIVKQVLKILPKLKPNRMQKILKKADIEFKRDMAKEDGGLAILPIFWWLAGQAAAYGLAKLFGCGGGSENIVATKENFIKLDIKSPTDTEKETFVEAVDKSVKSPELATFLTTSVVGQGGALKPAGEGLSLNTAQVRFFAQKIEKFGDEHVGDIGALADTYKWLKPEIATLRSPKFFAYNMAKNILKKGSRHMKDIFNIMLDYKWISHGWAETFNELPIYKGSGGSLNPAGVGFNITSEDYIDGTLRSRNALRRFDTETGEISYTEP